MGCSKGTSSDSSFDIKEQCSECPPSPKAPIDVDAEDINLDDIEIGIVTEIDVDGKGVYDNYMNASYQQLNRLYKEGKIKGAEFAAAMVAASEAMMKEANAFVLAQYSAELAFEKAKLEVKLLAQKLVSEQLQQQLLATQEEESRKTGKAERALKTVQAQELIENGKSKRALEDGQNNVATQQCNLYEAQADGFKDKLMNDAYRTTMNGWAVSASELENTKVPAPLTGGTVAGIDGVIQKALQKAGI